MIEQLKNEWLYIKIYWLVLFSSSQACEWSLKLAKGIDNFWQAYYQMVSEPLREIFNMLLGPIDN